VVLLTAELVRADEVREDDRDDDREELNRARPALPPR
jgi:hypothetical protein